MSRPALAVELKDSPACSDNKWVHASDSPVEGHPIGYASPTIVPQGRRHPLYNSMPPKPRPLAFSASTLLEIPSRLARPPSVKSIGKRWTLVPEMPVTLEDILTMRHISPLSLKDFEQYLLFEEYGAENLYFVLWLNDYTAKYNSGVSNLQLSHSVARAKATFFSSDSQYELNLAAGRVAEFYNLVGASDAISNGPPHPDALAAVRADVEVMLRTSVRRFVRSRSRNAGKQRALCVVFGGLFTITISLAPLMVSWFSDRSRWVRFGAVPPLWLGLTVFLCSVNGLCLILYLMGGSRQLYPFELARPAISSPVNQEPQSPYQSSFATMENVHDVKFPQSTLPTSRSASSLVQYPEPVHSPYGTSPRSTTRLQGSIPEAYVLPHIRPSTPLGDTFQFETAGFIPIQDEEAMTDSGHSSTRAGSTIVRTSTYTPTLVDSTAGQTTSSATKPVFDFDSLPAKTLDPMSGPDVLQAVSKRGFLSIVFGPITRIRSPVVSRAQWEVVIRSMGVAALVALAISAVLVAVPV